MDLLDKLSLSNPDFKALRTIIMINLNRAVLKHGNLWKPAFQHQFPWRAHGVPPHTCSRTNPVLLRRSGFPDAVPGAVLLPVLRQSSIPEPFGLLVWAPPPIPWRVWLMRRRSFWGPLQGGDVFFLGDEDTKKQSVTMNLIF